MKYKVGDRVRIVDEFLPGSHTGLAMESYRGTIVTIARIGEDHIPSCYWIEEDGQTYYWVEKTIAGYAYKITIEEFFASKDKLSIHCETEEEANTLLTVFRRMYKTWSSGDAYVGDNKWGIYKEATCYSNQGTFGGTSSYHQSTLYKFSEVDCGDLPLPENAMQVLLRDTLKWELAQYDQSNNCIKIKHTGSPIAESDILTIKNDERSGYVKCVKCGEIIKNTPEDIATHLAKKLNCLKCSCIRANIIKQLSSEYEKMSDGTYIQVRKTSCSLYCNQTWNGIEIDKPEVENICRYRNCSESTLKTLDGFFGKYPDAFDTVATIDALADKWEFCNVWANIYSYKLKSKTRITAEVNNKGCITHFQYNYYDNSYTFTYSAKYHKIIWMIRGEYTDEAPSNIKTQNITRLTNIMKEIYEEKTK